MSSHERVLIIEDELPMRRALEDCLAVEGYRVITADNGASGLERALKEQPDLILLDVMMPKLDGFSLCAELRRLEKRMPLLMLTAKGFVADRVRGLDAGADDYLVKPFSTDELLARVRALLRRSTIGQADVVEAGPLVVDHRARQVRVGGVAVRLSGREYELAAKLASDPQRVFTKTELLRDVWGIRGNGIRTRTVDSHASRLRRKLQAVGVDDVVVNHWGVGYRLLA